MTLAKRSAIAITRGWPLPAATAILALRRQPQSCSKRPVEKRWQAVRTPRFPARLHGTFSRGPSTESAEARMSGI